MNALTTTASAPKPVRVTHGGESVDTTEDQWSDVADDLVRKHGPGVPRVEYLTGPALAKAPPPAAPLYSDFGEGNQIVDDAAKARIEALHVTLAATGVNVDASQQFFATGTRMAKSGYDTQAHRKAEHDRKMPLVDAAHALREAVRAEQRTDETVSAKEFGDALTVNGKITAFGLAISEQAIRGLTARLGSPALGYILGLRKRVSDGLALPEDQRDMDGIRADKVKIAQTIRHECQRAGDVTLTLRTRKGPGDIFAIVSPSYSPADAPEVLDQILGEMPADAKGSWSYDPSTTTWELRGEVWTPTPVEQQAVGEPFEGYVSFTSRDNGTSRFRGGGGISLLRCLNASTYSASSTDVARIHMGNVAYDIARMLRGAVASIHALCNAWGTAREQVVAIPDGVTLEQAIPGFWRYLLQDRRSELVGVLPGRSETHVKALTEAYYGERRDPARVVRADLAQGWTKAIQSQPTAVRREAETAIADWLVRQGRLACDVAE